MPGPAQPYVAGDEGGDARLLGLRLMFLRAVGLVAPHAVERLHADVLPVFGAAWSESEPFVRVHFFMRGWSALASIPQEMRPPRLPALLSRLDAWAAAHNLNEPWLLDAALNHLRYELELGEALPLGSAGGTVAYWEPAADAKPPEYRPERDKRADYLSKIRRYMDDVEAEYARAGWSPARPPGEIEKQLVWLARHQVLGMTYDDVAGTVAAETKGRDVPDASTVRKGILRAAAEIRITLRAAPNRGR